MADLTFACLASDDEGRELLAVVLDRVERTHIDADGTRIARFEGDQLWTIIPPRPFDPRVPPSLLRILQRCGGTWLGEPGAFDAIELHDGFGGALHTLGDDCGLDRERDGFAYAETICAPIDDGLSRFHLFHPETGELRCFDQDGGLEEDDEGDPGTTFLRLLEFATR